MLTISEAELEEMAFAAAVVEVDSDDSGGPGCSEQENLEHEKKGTEHTKTSCMFAEAELTDLNPTVAASRQTLNIKSEEIDDPGSDKVASAPESRDTAEPSGHEVARNSAGNDLHGRLSGVISPRRRASMFVGKFFSSEHESDTDSESDVCVETVGNAYSRRVSGDLDSGITDHVHLEEPFSEDFSEDDHSSKYEGEEEEEAQATCSRPCRLSRGKFRDSTPWPATSAKPSSFFRLSDVKREPVSSPTVFTAGNRETRDGWRVHYTRQASVPAVLLFMRAVGSGKPSLVKFLLLDGPVDLGRRVSKLADVNNGVLAERSVSRNHATIYYIPEEDNVYIRDHGSLHGTFVNGLRISSPTVLQSGDLLLFGQTSDALAPFEVRIVRDLDNAWTAKGASVDARITASNTAAFGKELVLAAEDASNGRKRSHEAVLSDSALDEMQERISEDLACVERRVRRKITVTSAISSLIGGLIGGVSVGAALFGLSQLEQ